MVDPRVITGPLPISCLPCSFSSIPGASVAKVTSTTMATPGSSANALVVAPANVISSCATATAATSPGAPPPAVGRDQARRLERHERPQPVVHGARHHALAQQLYRLSRDHRDVADADDRPGLVSVLGPDVDVQVLELGLLLALLVLEQVDRLLAHDALKGAVTRDHLDPLADEDLRVPPADAPKPQVALVVDVADDEADLVDVADHDRQGPVAGALDPRHRRAHDIARDLGELIRRFAPHARRRGLVAGRAGSGEKRAQDVGERHRAGGI